MQRYTVYLYLETALHLSGGTSTHHQERIQLYLQYLVFVTPLLLSAAILEELEPVWVCCGWRTPPTAHSNRCILLEYEYIGILLGAHPIIHISRIRVKQTFYLLNIPMKYISMEWKKRVAGSIRAVLVFIWYSASTYYVTVILYCWRVCA